MHGERERKELKPTFRQLNSRRRFLPPLRVWVEALRRTQLRRGRPEEELSWLVGGGGGGFFWGGDRRRRRRRRAIEGESPGVLERGGVGVGGGGGGPRGMEGLSLFFLSKLEARAKLRNSHERVRAAKKKENRRDPS